MRFLQVASLLPLSIGLAAAQNGAFCACSRDGPFCSGDTPQCTVDNKPVNNNTVLCCASGTKALNGKCLKPSANICGDGSTVCSDDTPQCTVDNSVYADSAGEAYHPWVCCPNGHKSVKEICVPGGAKLQPCYQDGPCDWGAGYYCAWNAGNADSRCCKLDEYMAGTTCVKKP